LFLDEFPAAAFRRQRRRITIHRHTGKIKPDRREKRRKMSSKKAAPTLFRLIFSLRIPRFRPPRKHVVSGLLSPLPNHKNRKNIRQNVVSGLNPPHFRVTLLIILARKLFFSPPPPQHPQNHIPGQNPL
jgi:hypothetical protein